MGVIDRLADRIVDRLADGARPAPKGRRPKPGPCPACGAGPERREDSCGFGTVRSTLCGACGHVFKPEES